MLTHTSHKYHISGRDTNLMLTLAGLWMPPCACKVTVLVCSASPASVELTRDFCEQLDGLVGPQLTLLASDICEQFNVNRRISGSGSNLYTPVTLIIGRYSPPSPCMQTWESCRARVRLLQPDGMVLINQSDR